MIMFKCKSKLIHNHVGNPKSRNQFKIRSMSRHHVSFVPGLIITYSDVWAKDARTSNTLASWSLKHGAPGLTSTTISYNFCQRFSHKKKIQSKESVQNIRDFQFMSNVWSNYNLENQRF